MKLRTQIFLGLALVRESLAETDAEWVSRVSSKYYNFLEDFEFKTPVEWSNRVYNPAPKDRNEDDASFISVSSSTSTEGSDVRGDYFGTKPHILVFLMDDLGYHDVGYADKPRRKATLATPFITDLAKEQGIILTRHYAHWHCSPSRRAFLSGRLPVHSGGEDLSDFLDDDMDVRFTWISEKLKSAGYLNFFYGKHHLGSKTVRMLPSNRGFEFHYGFIQGSMSYTSPDRWLNLKPYRKDKTFTTKAWGDSIVTNMKEILRRDPTDRVFLLAAFQTPHTPLQEPPSQYRLSNPNWASLNPLDRNIYAADYEIRRIVKLFQREEEVWNNTLVVFLSDNGGTKEKGKVKGKRTKKKVLTSGNNFPLRSEKGSSFEGAYRVTSFISGGIVPPSLRGTKNDKISHIVDWYRTFCNLAGVDGDDDPPTPIAYPNLKPGDVDDPQLPTYTLPDGTKTNPYGESYPKVDSIDLWPMLMHPGKYAQDSVRPYLVLGTEAIIKGDYKLVLGQPCATGIKGTKKCKSGTDFGWDPQDDNLNPWSADSSLGCLKVFDVRNMDGFSFQPCLFNLATDERERFPIDDAAKINELWADLNQTLVYQYNVNLVGKEDGVSPAKCMGICFAPEESQLFFYGNKKVDLPAPRCGLDRLDTATHSFC